MWKREKQALGEAGFPNSIERWAEWKCCLGELGLFNAFFVLKTIFSRHRLIKISMTCVYLKPEVKKKKRYNSNDCRYKWCFNRAIRWKLLCERKVITFLIAEHLNLLKTIFLVRKVTNLLRVGWDTSSYPRVFHKGSRG